MLPAASLAAPPRLRLLSGGGCGKLREPEPAPYAPPGAFAPRLVDRIRVAALHAPDVARGAGWVEMPFGLDRTYPVAARSFPWRWAFPGTRTYRHGESGPFRRRHLHESVLPRAAKDAIRRAGVAKHASRHTFRRAFATHLLEDGHDIRAVPDLLGHPDSSTTMLCTHVLGRGVGGVRSPADRLGSCGEGGGEGAMVRTGRQGTAIGGGARRPIAEAERRGTRRKTASMARSRPLRRARSGALDGGITRMGANYTETSN
jgi:hypothetical protein